MKTIRFSKKILRILGLDDAVAGLDISDTSVRYAYSKGVKWQTQAVSFPQGVLEKGVIKNQEAYRQVLVKLHKQITQTNSTKRIPVAVSLSSYRPYSQIIKIPLLAEQEMRAALALNMQVIVPKNEDVYTSTEIISRNEQDASIEALGAFARQEIIDQQNAELLATGFLPVAMEWKAISVARFIRSTRQGYSRETAIIVVIDEDGVNAIIVRKGNVYFDYAVSWNDVIEPGTSLTKNVLMSTIEDVVVRIFNYHRQRYMEPVTTIIVSAGGVQQQAEEAIARITKIPVLSLDVATQQKTPAGWVVALGSGLRGAQPGSEHQINIIGAQVATEARMVRLINFLKLWQIIVPVSFAIMLAIALGQDIYVINKKNQSTIRSAEIIRDQTIFDRIKIYAQEASTFNALAQQVRATGAQINKKSPLLAFITEQAAVREVVIESYAYPANSQVVTIQASAKNQDQLTQFQKDITQSSFGVEATIPLTSIKATSQGVSCTISVSIQSEN
ncbi:MAG: hypothetical protein RIQ54_160 [Candidatus Parcubacteria bacterium]